MAAAVATCARRKVPRPKAAILLEINHLRRWSVIADSLSQLTTTAEGRTNLRQLEGSPSVQALQQWLGDSAVLATWGARAGQLRSMAQELDTVVTKHQAATERRQYAMHYADSGWQFRGIARTMGKPVPRPIAKVVVQGEVLTDPINVQRELDSWAQVSAHCVYTPPQFAAALHEYDTWLDRANIHPPHNQAAIDRLLRPLERWELDKQLNKKAGMAAGDDLLTWELLQDLEPPARQALFDAYAHFWDSNRRGSQPDHNWHYPDALKHAWCSPIPKTGYIGQTDRLRPISVTPAPARCYNKIVCDRLTEYLESQGCLCRLQAGFRSGMSTHEPLARLEEFLATTAHSGGHVLALDQVGGALFI